MKITENEFLKQVTDLLTLCGWRYTHFRPAINQRGKWLTALQGSPGFPDIVAVRKGKLIFAELKSDKGELSDAQEAWIYELSSALNIGVYVWKPSSWDEIVEILS